MDINKTVDALNKDYDWLVAHEMGVMAKDILDGVNTIIYLNQEVEKSKIYINNYRKAFDAIK